MRKGISGLLLALGIVLLGWGLIPPGQRSQRLELDPARLRFSPSAGAAGLSAGATLTLEAPTRLRAGDSALARLVFSDAAAAPIFESYNLLAEARLEIPGASLRPASSVKQPLRPAQTLTFFWTITAPEAGEYNGTAWVYLTFVSLADNAETRLALAAIPLQIRSTRLAGLTGEMARRLGALALLAAVGATLVFGGRGAQGCGSG